MADEVFASYPEGFNEWNEKLFILFMEGVKQYPPELVLGSMEAMKIIYLTRGANQQPIESNEEESSVEDLGEELEEEKDDVIDYKEPTQ